MKKIIFITICILGLYSCISTKHKVIKVHAYKVHNDIQNTSNINDDWIYWYLIISMDNSSYYYTSSSIPISNFSNVTWSQSLIKPIDIENKEEMQLEEIDVNEVPEEIQNDAEQSESNEQTVENESVSTSESTDVESGSSGSDGDSGDSGGGDSGGGD